jgi:hypothetical protein
MALYLLPSPLMIPVINLGQRSPFQPTGALQWLATTMVAVGWVLTTTVATGITRIITSTK